MASKPRIGSSQSTTLLLLAEQTIVEIIVFIPRERWLNGFFPFSEKRSIISEAEIDACTKDEKTENRTILHHP